MRQKGTSDEVKGNGAIRILFGLCGQGRGHYGDSVLSVFVRLGDKFFKFLFGGKRILFGLKLLRTIRNIRTL